MKGCRKTFYVIAYDITDDRRRAKVVKRLEKCGVRSNYSVLLIALTIRKYLFIWCLPIDSIFLHEIISNGMKIKHYILLIALLVFSGQLYAQGVIGFSQIERDFPVLFDRLRNELQGQKANYIFAIDVSGTMNQYADIVVPAMSEFISSLSEGDNISFIRFGTKAKVSMGGLSEISKESVQNLRVYVRTLYDRDPELYAYTDLKAVLEQINQELRFQKNSLTFIFVLTDFVDDPANKSQALNESVCAQIQQQLDARAVHHQIYMYALQLPVGRPNQLGLFKKAVPAAFRFETFSIASQTALKSWFERKKTEILLDKFKAIVENHLRGIEIVSAVNVDVDGKVILSADWEIGDLLNDVSIENIALSATDEAFSFQLAQGLPCPIGTGQIGTIKHSSWGIHHLDGSLQINYLFPSVFDEELKKLGVEKPQAVTSAAIERDWIFTFILPFWLTCLFAVIVLLYLCAVGKAFIRNRSSEYKINGNFIVNYRGRKIANMQACDHLSFGVGCKGGPFTIAGNGCNWQLVYFRQTPSPFLPWKKPCFKVRLEQGRVMRTSAGSFMSGDITRIYQGENIILNDFMVVWM